MQNLRTFIFIIWAFRRGEAPDPLVPLFSRAAITRTRSSPLCFRCHSTIGYRYATANAVTSSFFIASSPHRFIVSSYHRLIVSSPHPSSFILHSQNCTDTFAAIECPNFS
jgi:hypothetical protein